LPAMDWGQAATIAGAGIGMVAVVLILLAVATWLMGVVVRRTERRR
jgi:Na+-transporting methylmalonyl-CoA/oxaloacetate decarboxylase gamma subunit